MRVTDQYPVTFNNETGDRLEEEGRDVSKRRKLTVYLTSEWALDVSSWSYLVADRSDVVFFRQRACQSHEGGDESRCKVVRRFLKYLIESRFAAQRSRMS